MTKVTVDFGIPQPPPIPTEVTLKMTHEQASVLAATVSGLGATGQTGEAIYQLFRAFKEAGYVYDGSGIYSKRAGELYRKRNGLTFSE